VTLAFPLPASRFPLPDTVFLPLLVAVSIAASECRFSSPFGKTKSLCATIPPTNCRRRRNRGVEIGFSLFTSHYSLLTIHCEAVAVWQNKITVRYNTADQLLTSKESGS
jgi:hypothetical protein